MTGIIQQRRGVTAVLAMLYMTLMASLAVGFYAAINVSVQTSYTDAAIARTLGTAESGMELLRYQLYNVRIPSGTKTARLFDELHKNLADRMQPTLNMEGRSIQRIAASNTMYIPAMGEPGILTGDGGAIRAHLQVVDRYVVVKIVATRFDTKVSRAIQMTYNLEPVNPGVFNYGVTSLGRIKIGDDFDLEGDDQDIDGSLFAAGDSPEDRKHGKKNKALVEIKKKATISGDVFMSDPDGWVKIDKKAWIHGTSDPEEMQEYIHKGVEAPEFPVIDVTQYKPYATQTYTGGKKDNDSIDYYKNVVIPPNTNPHFDKDTVIDGVLYIKMPNKVKFAKHTTVRGVIVVEPSSNPQDYKDNKNTIDFGNGSTFYGIQTLPINNDFPEELHDMSGFSVIAPDTQVKFKGKSGAWAESIISEDFSFSGHASGMISGSIISYGDVKFNKKGGLAFDRDKDRRPALAAYWLITRFVPDSRSYEEVSPNK